MKDIRIPKYKEIEVEIKGELKPQEKSVIEGLFRKFPEKEINFLFLPDKIVILLHSLDFQYFKTEIEKIISKGLSDTLNHILYDALLKIQSIKSYGLKGRKRVFVGYDEERKVMGRKKKEMNRGKYFYAQDHNFSKTSFPVPKDFENKIICGDSEEILKSLPPNCVDLIFTSPPYNFGLEYETTNDAHYWENYFNKLFRIFDECIRVLKFGGRIIVNIQPLFSDYIPSHHIISNFFIGKKLIWKGEIIWEKNNYNCKYTAWGSWKSPSNPYLKYTWEFLEIFSKGTLKKEGERNKIDISSEEFKKWVIAKWSIAPERNMKEYNHPAMFPEELALRVIKLFSFENDFVLDPFNGVGTTTYVAKIAKRRFLGIDISKEYCEKAQSRIEKILF